MKIVPTVRWAILPTLIGVLFTCASPARPANAELLIKPGDRVVFLGDSITEFRNYTRPIQDYIYGRYPNLKVRFFNAGWSGDVTGGGLNRLERDVLSLNPSLVTICFGMNDGHYAALTDDALKTYRTNMDEIVKALKAKNVRVVIFSPSCVDYDKRPPLRAVDYNKTLEALAMAASDVAKKYDCTYYDILHPMLAAQTALKAKQPDFTMIPDGIHPDEAGGIVMGGLMLKGLGAEPMPVLANVDAAALAGDKASGDYTLSIPQPVDIPLWMPANAVEPAAASGVLDLVGQKLQVSNLAAGTYEVKVGNHTAGIWSNTALAAGVIVPPAYTTRSQRLNDVTNWKEQNYFNAWRILRLGDEQSPAIDTAIGGLMQGDDGFAAAIEGLRAPLTPVTIGIQSNGLPAGVGANLALKKSYDTNDPNLYNFGLSGLTDGSWEANAQHTFATGDKDTFPKTATIDLGAVASVSHVRLGVPPFGSTKTIEVSLSADGKTFTPVGSYIFSQNRDEKHTFAFAAAPARFVRLTYPDHYPTAVGSYAPTFSFTSEVEVYGPAQ